MANLVKEGTNKAVEEMEFTFIYYKIAQEFLLRWSALGMIGKNKSDAYMAVTGIGVHTDSMIDFESSIKLIGEIGAAFLLKKIYKPFPNFY